MMKRVRLVATTTGSAGSAAASVTSPYPITGTIVRVDVNYHASAPATTDVTLAQATEEIATNIVSLTDNATDKQIFPAVGVTTNAGVALTYDATRPIYALGFPVADNLVLTVAQCNALTNAVIADVYYEG